MTLIDARRQAGLLHHLADQAGACAGHISEAFSTTVLPQASGIATARMPRITGAFHGAMPTHDAGRLAQRPWPASPACRTG